MGKSRGDTAPASFSRSLSYSTEVLELRASPCLSSSFSALSKGCVFLESEGHLGGELGTASSAKVSVRSSAEAVHPVSVEISLGAR